MLHKTSFGRVVRAGGAHDEHDLLLAGGCEELSGVDDRSGLVVHDDERAARRRGLVEAAVGVVDDDAAETSDWADAHGQRLPHRRFGAGKRAVVRHVQVAVDIAVDSCRPISDTITYPMPTSDDLAETVAAESERSLPAGAATVAMTEDGSSSLVEEAEAIRASGRGASPGFGAIRISARSAPPGPSSLPPASTNCLSAGPRA